MFLLIPIGILAVCLFLSKASHSKRIWKFCWINILVLLGYGLPGWWYVFKYLAGGESFGPTIVFFTIIFAHIVFLLIATVVMTMAKASKDQGG